MKLHQRIGVAAAVVLGCVVIAAAIFIAVSPPPPPNIAEPTPSPKPGKAFFVADIKAIEPNGDNYSRVSFTVTNTGQATARPECLIKVSSPSGLSSGENDVQADHPLAPGQSVNSRTPIAVTGESAKTISIRNSEVTCT